MSDIERLTNIIVSDEGKEKAKAYVAFRGLVYEKLKFAWFLSGGEVSKFSGVSRPNRFVDSLFIPILNPLDQSVLGFDIRYCGGAVGRIRYTKVKAVTRLPFFYNLHSVLCSDKNKPIVVVEGAMDAETVLQLGLDVEVLGTLTTYQNFEFILFLASLSSKVLIMFDNDDGGLKAKKAIFDKIKDFPALQNTFINVGYRGKDVNKALTTFGSKYLKQVISINV